MHCGISILLFSIEFFCAEWLHQNIMLFVSTLTSCLCCQLTRLFPLTFTHLCCPLFLHLTANFLVSSSRCVKNIDRVTNSLWFLYCCFIFLPAGSLRFSPTLSLSSGICYLLWNIVSHPCFDSASAVLSSWFKVLFFVSFLAPWFIQRARKVWGTIARSC